MATHAEIALVERHGPYAGKRVLEVGSAYGHSEKLRNLAKDSEYVGVDMQPGDVPGRVQILHNLNSPLETEPFDVIFCLSVLEHCNHPWLVAANVEPLLKPGGLLLLSAPFQWRVHAYPSDYFRYTFYGLRVLFQNIDFQEEETEPPKVDLTRHTNGHILLLMSGRKK